MNKKRAIISVVIPNFNRKNTVGETIESIIAQNGLGITYDLEIIIGDDLSTDNARDVLNDFKSRFPGIIKLIFHETNIGLGANWATCVKESKGEFICNCDNDDYWHNPNKLQLQLDYMRQKPECNVLITDHRTHNRTTGEIIEGKAFIRRDIPLQDAMWGNCSFCNATIMYRADFLKSHINLDDFIERHFSLQDWPVWVILSTYTDFDILPVSTATFGIETVSITRPDSASSLEKRLNKDYSTYKYLCELFPDNFNFTEDGWKQYVYKRCLRKSFKTNDYESALYYRKQVDTYSMYKIFSSNKLFFTCFQIAKRIVSKLKAHN